jgi:uncharacterized protein
VSSITTSPLTANPPKRGTGLAWAILIAPPILFFMLIIAASVWVGVQGTAPDLIAARVQAATPLLLLAAQVVMLGLLLLTMRLRGLSFQDLGWKPSENRSWWVDAALGGGIGAALGVLYIFVLAPLLTVIQQTLGDYVPAGETLTSLGSSVLPFFVANVVLAPFVEENVYRGFAFQQFSQRYSRGAVIVIVTLFFGLLHWAGGFWYILLTGLVAGGTFIALRIWRGNLIAPFAAHLALNLVEFILIALLYS